MRSRNVVITIVAVLALSMGAYLLFVAPQNLRAPGDEGPRTPEGWVRATTSAELSFAYPPELGATYLSAAAWPPMVETVAGAYSCALPVAGAVGPVPAVEERTVRERTYCVSRMSEGAAGSMYVTYDYTTDRGDGVVRAVFTIRFPQCLNYDEPNRSSCQAEQLSFDPDTLASGLIESAILP